MTRAYLGLGSNVGDRLAHLRAAVSALGSSQDVSVVSTSPVYETDPIGPPQPAFLNAAVLIETSLGPRDLLARMKQIEDQVGRSPGERWGPREVDLDLLLYGEETVEEDDLVIPHPRLTERAFAMVPLLDIDPEIELPSGEPLAIFCEDDPAGVRAFPGELA